MPGKRSTPDEKAAVFALRSAGYSLAVISEKTRLSVRTVSRILTALETKPEPINEELYARARKSVLDGLAHDSDLRGAIVASIADDLALCARIREKVALGVDMLALDDSDQARVSARALAQFATALKATQSVTRKALGADDAEDGDELAVLEIREMTREEVEEARRIARPSASRDEDVDSE